MREPQRAAQFLSRGLAALILLSLVSTIAFFVVAGDRHGSGAAGEGGSEAGLLSSRTADPAPLTIGEIFPDATRVVPPGAAAYRITRTHLDANCGLATTGTLGGLLAQHGCDQVVRAGMASPYADYEVTAGLFNLADAAGATDVDDRLRQLVETGDGSFATLPAGHTDPDGLPTAQVGWRTRGHYLLYCVITRPGGRLVTSDDPIAQRINGDLVDGYLGSIVLGKRAARA